MSQLVRHQPDVVAVRAYVAGSPVQQDSTGTAPVDPDAVISEIAGWTASSEATAARSIKTRNARQCKPFGIALGIATEDKEEVVQLSIAVVIEAAEIVAEVVDVFYNFFGEEAVAAIGAVIGRFGVLADEDGVVHLAINHELPQRLFVEIGREGAIAIRWKWAWGE